MKMETEMTAVSTCSSVGSNEVDQDMLPASQHPGSPEAEDGHKSYPPSPQLSAPISSHDEEVEEVESSHHIVAIPEPHTCRVCDMEEDERDDELVELGCSCKGGLSRMHKKCILQWYTMRMLWQNNKKCEICQAVSMGTEAVVREAVSDGENGGRAVLMATLKSKLAGLTWMPDLETAANYDELVKLLTAQKVEFFKRRNNSLTAGDGVVRVRWGSRPYRACSWRIAWAMGMVAVFMGACAYVLYHFFGWITGRHFHP